MNIEEVKTKAKQILKDAATEEGAEKELTNLGLENPSVIFSEPNRFGDRMEMGMAFYMGEIINF